jgi:chromate transport protein ChrA
VTPLERPAPPTGEEIHLPGPSLQPLLLAVGVTLALLGATVSLLLVIVGSALFLGVLIAWVRGARRELEELPLEHHH